MQLFHRSFPGHRLIFLISLLLLLHSPAALADEPWTLIAVPDTQHYVDDPANVDDLMTQMTWIADNLDTYDVAFVTQLGDLVQHGSQMIEWDRAEAAMDIIDGLIPYSLSMGDHDYKRQEDRGSGADEFVRRFGAARYQGRPWYGGSSPDQRSHYQIFTAGGRQFLHLNIEWEAPGSVDDPGTAMGWARQVLDTHATLPTIVSTHSYVWDKGGQKGRTNGVEEVSGDGSSGERMWIELFRNSPQVFMVLNGNFHRGSSQYNPTDPSADPSDRSWDGEWHQVSHNLHGLPVFEMLSCYQDYPNGGDGWIRLIQFQPGAGAGGQDRISVQTYSTTHDAYQTDEVSQFHFDLDFAARFENLPAALPLQRQVFTAGADTFVWKNTPASNYGQDIRVHIDKSDGGPQQGLMRFDVDVAAALPQDAEIVSAQLRVLLTDSGDGFQIHRMRVPWDESTVTWDVLGGGVSADDVQAVAVPDSTTFPELEKSESPCHSIFDVTQSVRAWHGGEANHGLALLPLDDDKLSIASFQDTSFQPQLVIDYVSASGDPGDGGGEPGGDPVQVTVATGEDTYLWRKQPADVFGSENRVRVDLSDGMGSDGLLQPMQGLIRFDIAFGSGTGKIPQGATITSAELRLRLTDSGSGFRLHRMLVPWSESTATWDSLSDGVADDDTDASSTPDVITADPLVEPGSPAYHGFDVSAAVRAWQSGQSNHGWVLLPLGDDKLIIESFQGSELRPELVITYQ